MCLSRDCGLVSLGHPLGTGVVRKAPARDVLMVLGVAVAWTPLAVLVSSTIFININCELGSATIDGRRAHGPVFSRATVVKACYRCQRRQRSMCESTGDEGLR